MKKILLLTSNYYPNPSANGICVHKVAEELMNIGYEVHLISYGKYNESKTDQHKGVKIYRVKMPLYFQLIQLGQKINNHFLSNLLWRFGRNIKRIKLAIYLPFYPMTSIISIFKFLKITNSLHKKHQYDILISSYNPIEGVIAGKYMKEKYNDLKFGLYILDSFSNTGSGRFVTNDNADKMGWKWEKRLYEIADKVFILKSHYKHHKLERYLPYKKKIEVVDIPLLNKPTQSLNSKKTNKNDSTVIVYTGNLNIKTRNPEYMCKIFSYMNDYSYKVNVYSRGDCEPLLQKYENKTKGIINRKGFVSHQKSLEVINSADVLISIGNYNSDMIPSKIFEYMSTGKPIIHFYYDDTDSSLPYLKHYPLALTIKQDNTNIKENAIKISKFISQSKNETMSFSEIRKLFELNSPEYTVAKINMMLD